MNGQNPNPSTPGPSSAPALSAPIFDSTARPKAVGSKRCFGKLRRFLAWNPWYPASAVLILYSCYLVSVDKRFLPTEVAQLIFNLGSLQLYEILVATTAIFLARRALWYDSTLLVVLENLIVLVPFILISQAALIDQRLVWLLCGGAFFLALGRLRLLSNFITRLNFPPRMLAFATLVFGVNAALPVIYRVLHESKVGTRLESGAAYETNQYLWWLLVPVLCCLGQWVPAARLRPSASWAERHWLPLGLFSLWLAGTGVHLYCLGYVYDFPLRPELLAPAVWTVFWVLCLRLLPSARGAIAAGQKVLWVLPALATLLATPQPGKEVFLALTILNVAVYAFLYRRLRVPLALHLIAISAVALLAGLPENWGRGLLPGFSREKFAGFAAIIYLLGCIALSRSAKLGLFGALGTAGVVGIWGQSPETVHWAIQFGLAFLLLHSLRWTDAAEAGAALLRWLAAFAWVAHSVLWTNLDGAVWRPETTATLVFAVLLVFRLTRGRWGPSAVLLAAIGVLFCAPGQIAFVYLESAPPGLLAMLGSFGLFGLGTLGALTKHRWASSASSRPS